jgi:hypothetical protein
MARLAASFLVSVLAIASPASATVVGQGATPKVPRTSFPAGYCIELTGFGPERTPRIDGLIKEAIRDSSPGIDMAQFGRAPLSFYKARYVPGSRMLHLVFFIRGWDDIYMVYLADPSKNRLVSRGAYGSLHYPCAYSTPRKSHAR